MQGIGASLGSPKSVGRLQKSLHAKAKSEPSYRFYSLWDKIYRQDVLLEAYRRCRRNGGRGGVDGETFAWIESAGEEAWLGNLEQELRSKRYRSQPLLRVWIPKSSGGERPLSIPTIRDRVVQMAVHLVLSPIFEADFPRCQYGFRPRLDAKMAIRQVFFHAKRHGRSEVVDADLTDYFHEIPHGDLLRSVARRVSDGQVLRQIRSWIRSAVIERKGRRERRTREAARRSRGVAQGGPLSPLLANIYFRRFLLAWSKFGYQRRYDAHVVNYADDLVICCRPGQGALADASMRHLMRRLGLEVNEKKTKIVDLSTSQIDFLGYSIGRFFGRNGRPFLGTKPSKRAVRRVLRRIREETSRRWMTTTPEKRIEELNPVLRGWGNYFDQGPVLGTYQVVRDYTERRFRRWLMRRRGKKGTGYRQYPDEYLYRELGLFDLPRSRADLARAKA